MSNTLNEIEANLQSYVVAPLAAFGIGGFLFDAEGESIAHLSSDITDHYVENNDAIQDHIALRPNKITLKGYVGEVVYNSAGDTRTFLQQAVQKLTVINAFLPQISSSATQLQETLESPLNSPITLADASNIYGLVSNLLGSFGPEARQQNAYNYFKALMTAKVLMGVQTPWEFMTNMAIESVVALQDEKTKYLSDFSITLKQMRFAQTLITAYTPTPSLPGLNPAQQFQGVAALQAPDPVPIGNIPAVSLPSSTLPGWQAQYGTTQTFVGSPNFNQLFTYMPPAQ